VRKVGVLVKFRHFDLIGHVSRLRLVLLLDPAATTSLAYHTDSLRRMKSLLAA
jgi:hypothetical protein